MGSASCRYRLNRSRCPRNCRAPLASVHHYWNDLIRAENEMPFADDVNLSQLPALAGNLLGRRLRQSAAFPLQSSRRRAHSPARCQRHQQICRRGRASRSLRIFHRASERYGRSAVADLVLEPARLRAHPASDLGRRPHRVATRRNRVVASKAEGRFGASRGSIRRCLASAEAELPGPGGPGNRRGHPRGWVGRAADACSRSRGAAA